METSLFDPHLFAQALLYFAALVCGFTIAIPIGVNRINFNGQCILYGTVDWDKTDLNFQMTPGGSANCNFVIYFSVFALIFYGLGMGLYLSYAVLRSRKDPQIGSQMWVMPFILFNALVLFATLIVACIISVGFLQFCQGITKSGRFEHCSEAEGTWKYTPKNKEFKSGPYYKLLTVAQTAAWSCVLVWLVQIALSGLRFYRNRRLRSQQNMEAGQTTSDTAKISELEPTA